MGDLTLIYLFTLLFFAFSCGSPDEKSVPDISPDSVRQSISAAKSDTVPKISISPPPQSLSPNTMRVKGKVVEIHQDQTGKRGSIKIQIQQILAVGSSTPLTNVNDTLLVNISSKFDSLKTGTHFIGEIRSRETMGEDSTSWHLVQVEAKNDH